VREFDELWEVATRLNAPGGCPWDLKQTFKSLQPYVLEEAHEVVEAVDRGIDGEIIEELGDLLYTVLFYAKVAEKEGKFSMGDILNAVKEKLIRRHPHVFEVVEATTEEEVVKNWERIKKEKEGKEKKEFLKELPALSKAQKMLEIFERSGFLPEDLTPSSIEEEIGARLLEVVKEAKKSHVDSEGALRRVLLEHQKAFQKWESLL
jgi:MazG family protein